MTKQTTQYIDNQTGEQVGMCQFTYQGTLVKDVTIDFGNRTITLEKDCEMCISIVNIGIKGSKND